MSKSDLVEEWEAKIKDGKEVRDTWIKTFRIADLDKYYEGFQRPSSWPEDDFFAVNMINPNVREQMDNLYARNPEFVVKPKTTRLPVTPDVTKFLETQATLRQSAVNYLFKEKKYRKEIKRALYDAYVKFGVVKTYYEPYLEDNEKAGENFLGRNQLPVIDRKTGEELKQPKQRLVNEVFEVKRRNPLCMIFDPWADSETSLKWIAEEVEYTVEEIKYNDLFSNTEDIKATSIITSGEGDQLKQKERIRKKGDKLEGKRKTSIWGQSKGDYDEQEVVTCYEIYDLVNDQIIVIADGHDTELREDQVPNGIEGHPYEFLIFQNRSDSAYPIPEIFNQLGVQDEYNITRNQILLHRKRYGRKYEVGKNDYDEDELSKLEEPYDGMVIKRKGDGRITPIADPSLDQAVYFDTQQLKGDFLDIAGGLGEGQISKIEKATVGQMVQQRAQSRKAGKETEFYDFLSKISSKLVMLIEEEMTLPMAISIVGPSGQQWQQLHKGDIKSLHAEYNYDVVIGSTNPRNLDNDRSSWLAFLQILAASPLIGASEHLLRTTAEMFYITDETLIQELLVISQKMQKQQAEQGQAGKPGVNVPGQGAQAGGQ
jgi:hypothetical protein